MRSIFNNYRLPDLDDITPSEYFNTRIVIEGLYGWGVGYYNNSLKTAFETEVYDALKAAGYQIRYSKEKNGCDYLIKEVSRMNLYMHPMEFTGAATQSQFEEITEILNQCECIKKAAVWNAVPLYDISDTEYRSMIYRDAKNIALLLLENKSQIKSLDIEFEFANKCGIDRLCDPSKGCYSSSDVDVSAFNDIKAECIRFQEANPDNLDNKKIAEAVAQKALEWIALTNVVERTAGNDVYDEIHKFDDGKISSNYVVHLRLKDYQRIAERNGITAEDILSELKKVHVKSEVHKATDEPIK